MKILLLCSFSQSTANGITVRNLFSQFPSGDVAMAEFNSPIHEIAVPEIRNYYVMGRKEIRFIAPFHLLRKFPPSRIFGSHDFPLPERVSTILRKPNPIKSFLLGIQRIFLNKTGLVLVSRTFTISKEFDTWVRDFNPDIIYATTGDICKLDFIVKVKEHFGCKLIFHVFDDYVASKHEGTLFPGYWQKRLDQAFRRVAGLADLNLAIGDKMVREYTERYGKQFYGFHNPIDPGVWDRGEQGVGSGLLAVGSREEGVGSGLLAVDCRQHPDTQPHTANRTPPTAHRQPLTAHRSPTTANRQPPTANRSFNFLYAGKINRDTIGPIKCFIEACDTLGKQGVAVKLKIHSPYPVDEVRRMLGDATDKVYAGKIPYADLPAAFRAADGLLLPLDFTPQTIQYIRLSMLTKVSEYMISGTPIFLFAPNEIAVSEYLTEKKCAWHCAEPGNLNQEIQAFITNGPLRRDIAARAVEIARQEHMRDQVCGRLMGLVEGI